MAPKRLWNTVLPVLTRKRANATSVENARHASPPPAAAAADKPSTRNFRRRMRMALCALPLRKNTRPFNDALRWVKAPLPPDEVVAI
jgi:hypothetical protein